MLIVDPDPIMLGTLAPGQSAEARLTLRNLRSEAVTIERIETSCPCVRVEPRSVRVEAGESAALTIAFDPSEEPDFRGELMVDLLGGGPRGTVVFQTRAGVEVASEPRESP